MVERLRFAVDHIRLAIRDRFAVAYTAPDLTHHQTNSGYGRARMLPRNARSEVLAIMTLRSVSR